MQAGLYMWINADEIKRLGGITLYDGVAVVDPEIEPRIADVVVRNHDTGEFLTRGDGAEYITWLPQTICGTYIWVSPEDDSLGARVNAQRDVVAQLSRSQERAIFAKKAAGGGAAGSMAAMVTMRPKGGHTPSKNVEHDAMGEFSNAHGGWKSETDKTIIDYELPLRPLSDPHHDESIKHIIPGAQHIDYAETPFFGKLNALQGTPHVDAHTDPLVYEQHRTALFGVQSIEKLDSRHFVFTQPNVNRDTIKWGIAHHKLGGSPVSVVRYGGKDYLMDGHHRVAMNASLGNYEVQAHVLNLDTPSSIHPMGDLPPIEVPWTKQHDTSEVAKSVAQSILSRKTIVAQLSRSQERAIFAKKAMEGGAAGSMGAMETMRDMHGPHAPIARHEETPAARRIAATIDSYHGSDGRHQEMHDAWNDPRWQHHLAGKEESVGHFQKGIARGTEPTVSKSSPWKARRIALGGPAQGAWTKQELEREKPQHLYGAWAQHRADRIMETPGYEDRIREVNLHGLPADYPSAIRGESHVVHGGELLHDLPSDAQQRVLDQATSMGVTQKLYQDHLAGWFKKAESDSKGGAIENKHWYEAEHEETRMLAEHFGVPHELVAGIVASHSPQTGWKENRERTIKTLVMWDENPKLHVSQQQIDAHKKEFDKRELAYAKAGEGTQAKFKKGLQRFDPLPAHMQKEGEYNLRDIPPQMLPDLVEMGGIKDNTARAFAILHRGDLSPIDYRAKIGNFHNNIIAPHSSKYGTVDVWMARAAIGDTPIRVPGTAEKQQMSWARETPASHYILQGVKLGKYPDGSPIIAEGQMPLIREAIHHNAVEKGLSDQQYQAIVWGSIKKNNRGDGNVFQDKKQKAARGYKAKFIRHKPRPTDTPRP